MRGICKYCKKERHLCGNAGYCITCYRKYIVKRGKRRRCGKFMYLINNYCPSCYNYIGGYYRTGRGKTVYVRLKMKMTPRKCFFCNENRIEMLDVHHKKRYSPDPKDWVLLCPNHHREVHLGYKKLPVDNLVLTKEKN
jgi:hypothetical protein